MEAHQQTLLGLLNKVSHHKLHLVSAEVTDVVAALLSDGSAAARPTSLSPEATADVVFAKATSGADGPFAELYLAVAERWVAAFATHGTADSEEAVPDVRRFYAALVARCDAALHRRRCAVLPRPAAATLWQQVRERAPPEVAARLPLAPPAVAASPDAESRLRRAAATLLFLVRRRALPCGGACLGHDRHHDMVGEAWDATAIDAALRHRTAPAAQDGPVVSGGSKSDGPAEAAPAEAAPAAAAPAPRPSIDRDEAVVFAALLGCAAGGCGFRREVFEDDAEATNTVAAPNAAARTAPAIAAEIRGQRAQWAAEVAAVLQHEHAAATVPSVVLVTLQNLVDACSG